jgi:NMD protein affecting ribosome stability and mRNA decay
VSGAVHAPDTTVVCPRCGRTVTVRFYGPCDDCRSDLRAAYRNEGRVVEVAEYQPKMNVTPNAVASKDD